jgi:multiple sugar transport system substrate-binding protein
VNASANNFVNGVKQNLFVDLTSYLEESGLTDKQYYASLMDIYKQNGKQFAIPFYPEPLVVYYSKSWFANAGLAPPTPDWTWEQFAKIAKTLKESRAGEPEMYGAIIPFDALWIEALVISKGGSYIAPDGSKTSGYLDSPETVSALQWIVDTMIDTELSQSYPLQSGNFTSYKDLSHNAGMALDYYYVQHGPLGDNMDLGVAPLPSFEGMKAVNAGYYYASAISSSSKHPDIAWDYLREVYLANNEITQMWAKTDVVMNKQAAEAAGQNEDATMKIFIDEVNRSVPGALFTSVGMSNEGIRILNYAFANWIESDRSESLKDMLTVTSKQIDDMLALYSS